MAARIEVIDDGRGLPAPLDEVTRRARRGRGRRGRGLAIAAGVAAGSRTWAPEPRHPRRIPQNAKNRDAVAMLSTSPGLWPPFAPIDLRLGQFFAEWGFEWVCLGGNQATAVAPTATTLRKRRIGFNQAAARAIETAG